MLLEIMKSKIKEIELLKSSIDTSSIPENTSNKRPFFDVLLDNQKLKKNSIIAEIKRRSPSKGILCENLNLKEIAKEYQRGGASCISVLTEKNYFNGSVSDLIDVKKIVDIPILRKDFILDPIQIYESKQIGADCILLILSALSTEKFVELFNVAKHLKLDVLVEVHNIDELKTALSNDVNMIGINNRNLKTFSVDLNTSVEIAELVNDNEIVVISESGIKNKKDILKLNHSNIYTFLIGEYLVKSKNRKEILGELINV